MSRLATSARAVPRNIRWRLIAPFAALALLLAAYSVWWLQLASRLETEVVQWRAAQAERGLIVDWKEAGTEGFPYRLQLTFDSPTIEAPASPRNWSWSADILSAQMLPYDLDHVIVDIPGGQTLAYQDRNEGMLVSYLVHLTSNEFWASYVDEGDTPPRIAVDVTDLTANRETETDAGPVLAGSLAAKRLQLHGRAADVPQAVDVALRFEDIAWTGFGDAPWPGTEIARFDAQMRIRNVPEDSLSALGDLPALLAASDTNITLSEFNLQWGPIDMRGSGDVKLDERNRPEGRLITHVGNLDGLVRQLVAAGLISEQSAGLAFAGLTALSNLQGTEDGRVRLPVAMREGVLFLGPVAAGRLEPLF